MVKLKKKLKSIKINQLQIYLIWEFNDIFFFFKKKAKLLINIFHDRIIKVKLN